MLCNIYGITDSQAAIILLEIIQSCREVWHTRLSMYPHRKYSSGEVKSSDLGGPFNETSTHNPTLWELIIQEILELPGIMALERVSLWSTGHSVLLQLFQVHFSCYCGFLKEKGSWPWNRRSRYTTHLIRPVHVQTPYEGFPYPISYNYARSRWQMYRTCLHRRMLQKFTATINRR